MICACVFWEFKEVRLFSGRHKNFFDYLSCFKLENKDDEQVKASVDEEVTTHITWEKGMLCLFMICTMFLFC